MTSSAELSHISKVQEPKWLEVPTLEQIKVTGSVCVGVCVVPHFHRNFPFMVSMMLFNDLLGVCRIGYDSIYRSE